MNKFFNISLEWKNYLIEAITFLFILLFMYAAVTKLLDFENFQIQLEQFPFLAEFAVSLSWVVPAILITVALLFFRSKLRLVALYASLFLMIMFTGYIIAVLNFADAIPCSCGGVIPSLSWNQHLVFNIGFLSLAVVGIGMTHENKRAESTSKNNLLMGSTIP